MPTEVRIDVRAETTGAVAKLRQLAREGADAFARLKTSASNLVSTMTSLKGAFVTYGGYRIARAFYDSIGTIEQGWIGVAKTTGMAGAELDKFKYGIRNLSTAMAGLKIEELQNIAKVGGQIGITGAANLTEFTRVIGMMTVALDLSADEAATSFARIAKVMKEPISSLETLGSMVNALENTSAASARDIMDFAERVGGAANNIKLTSAEVFALGATLRELGVSSEQSGTAISQVLTKMLTDTGKFAEAAGVSTEDFVRLIETRPIEALKLLSDNMGKKGMFGAAQALEGLGLEGERVGGVLLKLAGGVVTLEIKLKTANDELKKGTSLQKEYATASEGLFAQAKPMGNQIKLFAEQLGRIASPALKGAFAVMIPSIQLTTASLKGLVDVTESLMKTPAPANITQFIDKLNEGKTAGTVEDYVAAMKKLSEANDALTKVKASDDSTANVLSAIKDINSAFELLDIQSSGQIVEMADKAVAAFIRIKESGTAAPGDIQRAFLAAKEIIAGVLDGLKGGTEVAEPEGGLKFAEDLEAAGEKGYTAIKEFQDKRAAEWDAYWNSKQFSTGPAADISAVEERLKSLKDMGVGLTGQTFSSVVKVEGVEDAIGKVNSLKSALSGLSERPVVIDIKGRGSAVLPISEKIADIKTMFGSLEDMSPRVTADFSAVSAGVTDAVSAVSALASLRQQLATVEGNRAALGFSSWAFSNPAAEATRLTRQEEGLRQSINELTMALGGGAGGARGPQTNLGGVVININGGSDPAANARAVRAEIKKLESRL